VSDEPQRLLVTADLHFGLYPTGDACTRKLADYVCASEADVFAIAGDIAEPDTDSFRQCLELFSRFKGQKLVVPGNHDLWTASVSSLQKYREILPAIAADCGFRMLDAGPVVLGRIGFIGSIGWYDYSFRNPSLNVSMEQYEKKEMPGVCTWNDVQFIDWDVSDEEFTRKCLGRLKTAYRSIEPRVHTVVAILHHVPFRDLLYGSASAANEFCRAFMGAEKFGQLLLDSPKVRYAFCGHRHGLDRCSVDHVEAYCVGSEYLLKRLIKMDLATGDHAVHVFAPESGDQKRQSRL